MITLTESAADKVRQLLETNPQEGDALRVRVTGGGCSGLRYELAFDSQVADSDEQIEQWGVRLLVDAKSAAYLPDITLDYADGLNESGFKIVNPSAKSICGCGESFGV
ncbi:MAG: iron-sulfur cluster assembly accessory protein [Deltaproteobacteria bacterium]|nr:iron-sulfur cluster assembly accessory protein [Deltaproteobacteria bacterium]MBW2420040.1 iron-sulfur cluster assembly accessory protein [Deltaproteobacteria bacterium]